MGNMHTIFLLIIAPLSFLILASMAMLSVLFTRSGDTAHRLGRLWGWIVIRAAGARLLVEGSGNIPAGRPVVFACNHASQLDIPVLYRALPLQFRFIVKQELFRIPFFGLAMRMTGYIPVDRSGGREAVRSLQEAARRIAAGTSVVVFPEGTRSPDGSLGAFKPGGMVVAIKAGVPVIPVAILGSSRVLPKGRLRVHPGTITVRIGPPIESSTPEGPRRKEDLAREAREVVAGMLGDPA